MDTTSAASLLGGRGSTPRGWATYILPVRCVRFGAEHLPEPYRTVALRLLEGLQRRLGDRLVSLAVYGSVARGTHRRDSDLDLLVVARGLPRGIRARLAPVEEAEDDLRDLLDSLHGQGHHVELSPLVLAPEEVCRHPPILLDMVEDAVIVYDADRFLQSCLELLAAKLKAMGARRVWVGRKWYWVLHG